MPSISECVWFQLQAILKADAFKIIDVRWRPCNRALWCFFCNFCFTGEQNQNNFYLTFRHSSFVFNCAGENLPQTPFQKVCVPYYPMGRHCHWVKPSRGISSLDMTIGLDRTLGGYRATMTSSFGYSYIMFHVCILSIIMCSFMVYMHIFQ